MDQKRLKIAFLSRYVGSVDRGVETFVQELKKHLDNHYEVDILSGKDADSLSKVLSGKYDIVIPTNGRMQALKMSFGRLLGNYKLVIGGHAGIGRDDLINILIRPDVFVALTQTGFQWAKSWSLGTKIVKIPNGIDLEKFKPEGKKVDFGLKSPIILSVGALEWYKHHEKVIAAVNLLDNVSLLIVGSGSQQEELNRLGNKKIPNRFKIMKFAYEKMPEVYRSVDLFTLPSWDREAFGIVYLEALATNIPVVAPNDLSRREIVGDGGILVDIDNQSKYADAIRQALSTKWGDKPRQRVKNFSWDKIVLLYEQLFKELVR